MELTFSPDGVDSVDPGAKNSTRGFPPHGVDLPIRCEKREAGSATRQVNCEASRKVGSLAYGIAYRRT